MIFRNFTQQSQLKVHHRTGIVFFFYQTTFSNNNCLKIEFNEDKLLQSERELNHVMLECFELAKT